MALSLESLSKHYGDKSVLRDFSFNFPSQGVVAVMGPSGCGKTTLLRLIAGLEQPDSGEVHLPKDTKLSMVFQEDRLLDTLTARENILVVMAGHTPQNRARADYCLDRCGLLPEADRYPGQLSGGMRRRVALARAVAYGGNLLLLDEPFKGLDRALKQQVMDFVLEGGDHAALTLLVTHDREEAERADHVLQLVGPPLKIIGG